VKRIRVILKDGSVFEGLGMPEPQGIDAIMIKLPNGYNIVIPVEDIARIEEIEEITMKIPKSEYTHKPGLPKVVVIGTGGTISSRVDYQSGSVYPAMSAAELVSFVPEILDIANIESVEIMQKLSEDVEPDDRIRIAEAVKKAFESGAKGVVIAHGTDTMTYSASAVAFMTRTPGPVVFVGAQRSSDRPSTDAYLNLLSGVRFAVDGKACESVIAMHGTSSDDYVLIHRGVRARKNHSTRRDAFMSISTKPIARVHRNGRIEYLRDDLLGPGEEYKIGLEKRVALVRIYPGIPSELIDRLADRMKGIVLAGTGMGHTPGRLLDPIRRAIENGTYVFMTTQCIRGKLGPYVYRRGRELLQAGVVPVDMLPEVAYVKLMRALKRHEEEVIEIMRKNLVGEILEKECYKCYPGTGRRSLFVLYLLYFVFR